MKPPIVLIHGFWVTPRSWEHWITRYEGAGHTVVAPAYPGFEVEVEALNRDPSPIVDLSVKAVLDKLIGIIDGLDAPPIIMGHSAGGVFTQLLLDRGYGVAGVAMNSAPTEGVLVLPFTQLKSVFPVLAHPSNRHKAVGLNYEQWKYAFTNTFPEDQSKAAYERYHIPASGAVLFDNVLANVIPGPQDTYVNYENDGRPPLLFLSGGEDHIMPPAVQRSNMKHYKSDKTLTEMKEYPGRAHLMPAEKGWEEVADYALSWAMTHARQTA